MLNRRSAEAVSATWGVVAGTLAGSVAFMTVGVWIIFFAAWGCVPAHRIPPAACSPAQMPIAFGLVVLIWGLAFWAAYHWARRWALKRLHPVDRR